MALEDLAPAPPQRPVRKLKTREVVRDYPNFRAHGMMVDTYLLRLLGNLQRRYGTAFASEAGLRRMICEDSGHMPGVDTIPCAIERLERQGLCEQHWLIAGGILPDGSPCTHGTRLVFLPQSRHQRRAVAARAAARNRRDGLSYRVSRHAAETLARATASIGKIVETGSPSSSELEARRRAQLDALAHFDPTPPVKREPDP